MSRKPKITVAGAGALGLTTALALADAGCEVSVFDPELRAANASGVAAGMLAPVFEAVLDPLTSDHLDLMLAARDLWPALEARLGVAIDRSGAAAVGDEDFLAGVHSAMRGLGLHPTRLPRRALQALAPGLDQTFGEAVLTREDWRIEPSRMLAALRAAGGAAGVVFHPRAATGFEGADRLVVATGAGRDLAVLAPALSRLTPIKGQIVTLQADVACGVALRVEGGYAVAGEAGLTLGATMEAGRDDREVDAGAAERFRALGRRLFPGVGSAPFTARAGVRAATEDGLPLVGQALHHGILLAVGARRNGWLLAPLVARIIAACVTEGEAGPYAARLNPERFGRN